MLRSHSDNGRLRTLVHHNGALGDLLLSLPCLLMLKDVSREVHLAGRGDVARFLTEAGVVDAAVSSDDALLTSLYSGGGPRLRTFLSRFDRALVFSAEKHPASAAAIRTFIPDVRVIGTIPPEDSRVHAAQYRLSQLEPDASVPGNYAVLPIPPDKAEAAQSLLAGAGHRPGTGLIAVHPGSGGRPKCWPLERYFELIERLRSGRDAFVVLFTGEAEEGKIRQEVRRYAADRKNTLHAAGLELMSAAALLSHCGLYVGNDSGFSHLAGVLGCRAVVLFGPTDPVVWKPLGLRVEAVSKGALVPMTEISVDDVISKAGPAAGNDSGNGVS